MTFLNPYALFGLLAIGLPILIHLLSKPRLREIQWAAIRFLLDSVQKNSQRTQVEDVLLLVLRCLLVGLLVLIFARPAFLVDGTKIEFGTEATTAVILLDNSASMGQSDNIQTRFAAGKTMADGILSKLASGSSAALFLVSDYAKPVIPKPTQDFSIVRRSLEQATLTDRGTDLYPGLKQAVDLLKANPVKHREIFVITDSQLSAWRELDQIRRLQTDNQNDIHMHFLIVGEKGEDNLAVSSLQMVGTVAAINQPIRCSIEVSNWGRTAVDGIPVKLATDANAPEDETMIDHIEPGAAKTVSLFAHLKEPGYHSITASIPGDRLAADNQRSMALLALEQVHALIVEGTSNPDPSARDGFFLRQALVPVRPDQVADYYMKVTVVPAEKMESAILTQYEVLFLSNVAQLSQAAVQNLQHYVNGGGALIIFPGPITDLHFYNETLSGLLPAKLSAAQTPPAGQKLLGWQSKDYEHPITVLWNDSQSGSLGSIRASKYFPLTPKPADPATPTAPAPQIVVKYADGEPAVMEQEVGKGKVFLFSSTATTEWETLPIHPAFVPLLLRMVSFATSGPQGKLNIVAGQPFAFDLDSEYAGKEVSVLTPGEKKRRGAGRVEQGEHNATLRYSDTDLAGPYSLYVGEEVKPKVVFAVQMDPTESNLTQEAKPEIEPLLFPPQPVGVPDAALAEKSKEARQLVPGKELWYPLVLIALLLALIETGLSHRFSQSK